MSGATSGYAELGGDALGPAFCMKFSSVQVEAGEPVEHRHFLAGEGPGRQIHGEAHLAAEYAWSGGDSCLCQPPKLLLLLMISRFIEGLLAPHHASMGGALMDQ